MSTAEEEDGAVVEAGLGDGLVTAEAADFFSANLLEHLVSREGGRREGATAKTHCKYVKSRKTDA